MRTSKNSPTGIALALTAFGLWGLFPLFWKQLSHVPAAELVALRVVFGALTFAVVALLTRQRRALWDIVSSRRQLAWFALSGVLLSLNWLVFLYAVETERIVQVSLGYYINPLLNVVLGTVLLRERLSRLTWIAVGLASAGVAGLALAVGSVPWIALVLAVSFGSYGLVRKRAPAGAVTGSTVELSLLIPLALAALYWRGGGAIVSADPLTIGLLVSTGVVTAAPIAAFVGAARRLPLSTLGFIQFLAPSMQLAVGVLVYNEAFGRERLLPFIVIWAGCALFSVEAIRTSRRAALVTE